MIRLRRLLPIVWLLLLSGTSHADLDAGLDAVSRKDYSAALVEFQILAEKGDPAGQVNLGNLYMKGWGVRQDYAAAYDWYRKAAENHNRIAESKLGVLHYYGLGTVKDSTEAAKWFEKGADQGDPSAQSALGVLYAQGDGLPRNLVLAFFWLTLAFEFGDEGTRDLRAQLAEEMNPGEMAQALSKVEEWKHERDIPDAGAAPAGEPSAPVAVEASASPKAKQARSRKSPRKK